MSGGTAPGRAPARLRVDTPVVVLNTHHSGLAVARDLGPLGVRVIGVTAVDEFPGNQSRWLEYRKAPDSLTQPPELLAFLLRLCDELGRRPVLLPTRDHDINFIEGHRAALDERFRIPMLDPLSLDRILNKEVLAADASSAGIPTPRTVIIRKPGEMVNARELRFPCICKPVYASQWRKAGIWEAVGRQKALRLDTYGALERYYSAFCELDPLVTVQEWIEGNEEDLLIFGSYCDSDHRVLASFTARKRLQYPPLAGTGIVVEALPLPELIEPSVGLLRRVRFRGISEIEYKRDRRDGRIYLIEINPRHWDQHGLGTRVGVNLSEALYRDVTGQASVAMQQDPRSMLWIAEAEYARHVARCLAGRAPLRDLSLGCGAGRTWAVFDREDMGPFWSMLGWKRR